MRKGILTYLLCFIVLLSTFGPVVEIFAIAKSDDPSSLLCKESGSFESTGEHKNDVPYVTPVVVNNHEEMGPEDIRQPEASSNYHDVVGQTVNVATDRLFSVSGKDGQELLESPSVTGASITDATVTDLSKQESDRVQVRNSLLGNSSPTTDAMSRNVRLAPEYLKSSDLESLSESVIIASTGTLTIYVKNVNGAYVAGAIVKLYDINWNYLSGYDRTTNPNGYAYWSSITDAKYYIEVYYPSPAALGYTEFWGGGDQVTVSGATTYTFTRHTQWAYEVKINSQYVPTTVEIDPSQKIDVDVTAKNSETVSKDVKVSVILDRSKSSPWDIESLSSAQYIGSGSYGYFSWDFFPSGSGTYYIYVVVYGYYNGKYIITDQFNWVQAFVVRQPKSYLYVEVSNYDDDSHRVNIYVDSVLWGYIDVASGWISTTVDKEVSSEWHTVKITWHDDDTGWDYEKSLTQYVGVGQRLGYGFSVDRHYKGKLYVKLVNYDDDYHTVSVYVGGVLWTSLGISAGQTAYSVDKEVLGESSYEIKVKWRDDDTNLDYEKSSTKDVGSDQRVEYAFDIDSHLSYVGIYVKNVNNVAEGSAAVLRYDSSWNYKDQDITDSYGLAEWVSLADGTYNFEVYNQYNEFWGDFSIVVGNKGPITYYFTRFMPYAYEITTSKSSINYGESITITVKVKNPSALSRDVRVKVFLDRSQSSPYDWEFNYQQMTIASGGSFSFDFTWAPIEGGTYYVWTLVETYLTGPLKWVKTDHWSWYPYFTLKMPDLVVLSISTEPSNPTSGQPFNLKAIIKNQGDGNAISNFYARAYIVDRNWWLASRAIGGLAAGSTAEVTWAGIDSNSIVLSLTTGSYSVKVIADSSSGITESDENNNERTVTVTVNKAKWTVVAYLDGEKASPPNKKLAAIWYNFIGYETRACEDILGKLKGSTTDVSVIALIDKDGDPDSYIYYVTNDGYLTVKDVFEANMGDPSTLKELFDIAKTTFQAERYWLLSLSHGSGQNIGYDVKPITDDLTLTEIKNAFSSAGFQADIYTVDACLMGNVRFAYQLRDYVKILIASPIYSTSNILDAGPWNELLSELTINPNQATIDIAKKMTEKLGNSFSYDPFTSSLWIAMDISKIGSLASNLRLLSDELTAKDAQYKAIITDICENIERYKEDDLVDLYLILNALDQRITDVTIKNYVQATKQALDALIIKRGCKSGFYTNFNGPTLEFSEYSGYSSNSPDYAADLEGQTNWLGFLLRHFAYGEIEITVKYPDSSAVSPIGYELYDKDWKLLKGGESDSNVFFVEKLQPTGVVHVVVYQSGFFVGSSENIQVILGEVVYFTITTPLRVKLGILALSGSSPLANLRVSVHNHGGTLLLEEITDGSGTVSLDVWPTTKSGEFYKIELASSYQPELYSRYLFVNWDDGESGNPRTKTLTADTTLMASYKIQHYLTVDSPFASTLGSGWYDSGTYAYSGVSKGVVSGGTGVLFAFTHWSQDASGTNFAKSDPIYMDRPKIATANWRTLYYLTMNTCPQNLGGTSGEGWYEEGQTATIGCTETIYPSDGVKCIFTMWSGDASDSSTTTTVYMDSPKTATANYKTQYQLDIIVSPTSGGSTNPLSGSNWYDSDLSVTVSETTASGYLFEYWSLDGSNVGSDPSITVLMNSPHTLTAVFKMVSHMTTCEIVNGANAILDRFTGGPHPATVTLSVKVKDTVTGEYLSRIGLVEFYANSVFIGSDDDTDGNQLYEFTWDPSSFWLTLGSQTWEAKFTGTPTHNPSSQSSTLTIHGKLYNTLLSPNGETYKPGDTILIAVQVTSDAPLEDNIKGCTVTATLHDPKATTYIIPLSDPDNDGIYTSYFITLAWLGIPNGAWTIDVLSSKTNYHNGILPPPFTPLPIAFYLIVHEANVSINPSIASVFPGYTLSYTVYIENTGSVKDTYELTLQGLPSTWYSFLQYSIAVDPGQIQTSTLTISPPVDAVPADYSFTVTATCQDDPTVYESANAVLKVTYNLIQNPGFEAELEWWSVSGGTATYTVSSVNPKYGVYSAFGQEINEGSLGRLYQDVTGLVSPGKKYKISGWIKTEGVTGYVVIALDYVTSGGASTADGYVREIGYLTGTSDWTYFESPIFTLPPMPADCAACWFLFDFNAGKGLAWWDDVQLVQVTARILHITAQSPINILVTDPIGRRVGYHPDLGLLNEIPGATYSGPGTEPQVVQIYSPLQGEYTIGIFGTGTGAYTINMESLAHDGSTIDTATWTGTTELGQQETRTAEVEPDGTITDITPPTTLHDFDGLWHKSDFTITLTAADDMSGVAETYYKINDGPTRSISADGQPLITAESANNKLEYWSVDYAGNEENHHILTGIKLDKTPPILSGTATTSSNTYGWYNNNVIVHFDANDAVSGIDYLTPDVTLTAEGEGQTVVGMARDLAGNEAYYAVVNINIDKTPPTISGVATTSPNANGWYKTDVTAHFEATDSLSGIDSVTADQTIVTEGADQFVTGIAVDKAGNTASYKVSGINIDKTAPTITGAPTEPANTYGWYRTDVTVHFIASDALSGLDTVTLDRILSAEAAGQSVIGYATDMADNIASFIVSGINIDKTPPTISGAPTKPENVYGWYKTNVIVHFEAGDSLSGLDTVTSDQILSSEGADQFVMGTAVDKAGNSASFTVIHINIDKTSPSIFGAATSSPNIHGWYKTDVIVHFDANDALSGLDTLTPDQTLSAEGAGQFVIGTATDKAGNTASFTVSNIDIDKTPPMISGAPTTSANIHGWYKTNVAVHFDASDSLSGMDSLTPDIILSAEVAGQSTTGIAVDKAGNEASYTVFGINIDKTLPTISGAPTTLANVYGWYNKDVTVHFTAADALSGVDTITSDQTLSAEGVGQSVIGYATDHAGNTASYTVSGINIDKTPPSINGAPTTPANAHGWYKMDVIIHFTASDSLSGVDTVTSDQTLSSEGAGQSVTGTAVDKAGNTAYYTVTSINIDKTNTTSTLTIGEPKSGTNPTYVSTTTQFTVEAIDGLSGVHHIEYKIDSGIWTQYLAPFNILTFGSHTLYYRSIDLADNTENAQSIWIMVNSTSLTYSGDISDQYSDPVTVQAILIDLATQLPIYGKTIVFTIGSQSTTAATDSSGTATASITLSQPTGIYTVTASFAGDSEYIGSSDSQSFTVEQENVLVEYTGDTVVPTTAKTINLRATVFDSNDGYLGDLTKLKVTFRIYAGQLGSGTLYNTIAGVSVSQTGTPGVGVALIAIANLPENGYLIIVSIDPNAYYTGPTSDPSPLTVYLPTGSFVTGGGWIWDPSGSKGNFGFNVKYTKSGGVQGHSIYVYRDGGWDYIVKSNAWIGLAIESTHAYFEGKCVIQKYNPATEELVWAEGNYKFRVDVWDNNPAGGIDVYQIRVLDKNGVLYHQAGFDPLGNLQGGNIVIHDERRK